MKHDPKSKATVKLFANLLVFCLSLAPGSELFAARPFDMAATAVQMIPLSAEPYRNGNANLPLHTLALDVDVLTIWPEYLGIPFDEFSQGPDLPPAHPWVVKMNQLAAEAAATNKPLMIELSLVRTGMVPKAVDDNGQLLVTSSWAPVCYDFTQAEAAAIGRAYVNYAVWMANKFNPRYLVNFIEANLYYADCGGPSPSWDVLVEIQKSAYDAIKMARPEIVVFPSIHIETLYGYELGGWVSTQFEAITALKRDLIGISSYPFGITDRNGVPITPYHLPADYLVRIMLRHPEESLAIAETGWNNSSISIGDANNCIRGFPYSEEGFARDYLQFVFASAHYGQFQVVNWWSMADSMEDNVLDTCYVRASVPYTECAGDPWCMVINYIKDVTFEGNGELFSELVQKAFGSMGLKRYNGTERPGIMQVWRNELQNTGANP